MEQTKKNIAIGILTLAACGLVVWVLLFLHPQLGDGGNIIRVRFSSIEKVTVGTRVTFAGKPVGEVVAINMVTDNRDQKTLEHDPIYAFELTLAIDSHAHIFDSDEISLKTQGLMGERAIAITPKRAKGRESKLLSSNALVYANSSDSVEETFNGINHVAKKIEQTMDEVLQMQDTLKNTLLSIEKTSKEMEKLFARANDLDIIDSANKMISKADTLMSDVNNYGLLFHLDKGWQRDRRKRIAELSELKTPSNFRQYLDEEMKRISISIDRVHLALGKAEDSLGEKLALKNTPESTSGFKKTYVELLGQIQALEKNLKSIGESHAMPAADIADGGE